jgi:hypothetical protein
MVYYICVIFVASAFLWPDILAGVRGPREPCAGAGLL